MSNNNQKLHEFLTATYLGDEDGFIDCYNLSPSYADSRAYNKLSNFWGMQLSGIKNLGIGSNESIPAYLLCGATIKDGIVDDDFFNKTSDSLKFTVIGSYSFYNCKNLKVVNLAKIRNSSGFSWGIDFSVLEELRLPSLALTSLLVSNEGSLKIVELKKAYINYSSKNSPTEKIISYQIPNLYNSADCFKYWNKDCILEIHDTTGIVSPRSGGYSSHPTSMTIKVPDSLLSEYLTAWESESWVNFEAL